MDDDKLDLLWGAGEIAAYIGQTERATYRYLENGFIPAVKVGKVWTASRKRLREFFEGKQEDRK